MAKKKKTSSFRGKVAANAKTQAASGSQYGYIVLPKDVKMYSPVPGAKEKIDIIPYQITDPNHGDIDPKVGIEVGELWYRRPFRVHKNVGADNDSVVCLQTWKKKCPICELRKVRAKEGASKDELQAYNSSKRSLYLVIPRGVKKKEEEIHIFDFSDYLFQDLLNEELSENPDNEIFPDIEEGLSLNIRWSKETFNKNTYAQAKRIDFEEREDEISEDILDTLPDLDKVLKELSYEAMEAKFLELTDEEIEEEDDEDETPKKEKKSKKEPSKKNKKKVEKKEEEEEEKDTELTWEDLVDMEETELAEVAEQNDIEWDAEEDLEFNMKEIAKAMGIEIPKKSKKEKPTSNKKETKTKSKDLECPEGFKFGVDTDAKKTKGACDSCDIWDKCDERKEQLEKEKEDQ